MAAPAPSPGRAALRDMSNEATPSPCARKAQGAVDLSDQATPPQAAWTTGDQFKFVEEDDDEVLFRVRDSGVLRSLALPELTRPEVVTPPNAVNADETLEQKQARVRELRMSLERAKPASLPPLKEALAGITEVSGAGDASKDVTEGGGELPKMKRPPPVLDDNLWDEITTEVKRKSMHEPASGVEESDDAEDATAAGASEEPAHDPSAEGPAPKQEAADSEESVDALANQIKAHIAGALAGTPAEEVPEAKSDESFHSCDEGGLESETVPDVAKEGSAQKGSESPGAGMTRDKLIEMGFSEEDADWAVQQAKEQEGEAVEPAAVVPVEAEKKEVEPAAEPGAAVSPKKADVASSPAEAVQCIRKAGCKCADCSVMSGLTMATITSPDKEAQQAVVSAAEPEDRVVEEPGALVSEATAEAESAQVADSPSETSGTDVPPLPVTEDPASPQVEDAAPQTDEVVDEEQPSSVAEVTAPEVQASPVSKGVTNSPPAKSPAAKASPAPASASAPTVCLRRAGCTCEDCAAMAGLSLKPAEGAAIKCIRKAGCKCADCAEMAGLTLATAAPAASSPAKEAVDEEPVGEQPEEAAPEAEADAMVAPELIAPVPADVQSPASAQVEDTAPQQTDEVVDEEQPSSVAEVTAPEVQASPVSKGVANSPPAKSPAVKASPAPAPASAPTVCLRRAGCTCEDCAAMAGLTLAAVSQSEAPSAKEDKENEAQQQQPEKEAHTNKTPAKTPAKTPGAKKPPSSTKSTASKSAAKTAGAPPKASPAPSPAPAVKDSPAMKGVANSPPAKSPAVKASPAPAPASAPTVCLRRAGCTCEDCAAMAGLSLKPAEGAAIKCIRKAGCKCADCAEMAGLTLATAAPAASSPAKEAVDEEPEETAAADPPAATQVGPTVAASPVKDAAPADVPVASPAQEAAVPPAKASPAKSAGKASSAKSAEAQVDAEAAKCLRKAGCPCADCAAMADLSLASKPPAAEVKCIRKAGCKCADCAAMAELALPSGVQDQELKRVSSPAQAQPSSSKKSALSKSATKAAKQSPAFKTEPEFKLIASPAPVGKDESEVFSPEGFDNAEALNNILEDDGLELEDFTELRISAVNEAMRAEMKAALEQHNAQAAGTAEPESVDAKPEGNNEWEVLKLSEQGMAAAAAPSSSSNSAAARYTLEDVERISSFNMETLKKKSEAEIADLCRKLDETRKDAKSSVQALQDENKTLKTTMQEAEKAIDELVAVVDKEKKEAAKHLKAFTDMKSYADELETAFNGLHGRYTKLKEYYTASDSNNQVLSKNLLDTNELLKNHQTQVQTLGDKLKVVEDEKALVADKLALAQRELTARDTSMLQLKSEAHALQQALSSEKLKMEDIKTSFATQLQSIDGGSRDAEERAARAEAEVQELRMQLKMVKEASAANESGKEQDGSVKMLKMQLQKAEIDKKSLQQQVENKTKENESLTSMCDELLGELEQMKAK